ncbi:hypothetical protein SLEP1_g41395 [Rubroshorea leprosula]|nr:hypothetical protein SLEP1_g41395 [Rubroshorea leprosula]
MVRSLISKNGLPKEFWPEAVNWSVHILNRSPTSPLLDIMPEEAWSGRKPAVDYFKIFGCIAYAHVPNQKRSKFGDKGGRCIFLGVSDQSKAYRLYNPITKKVIISRDVVFDEASTSSWTEKSGRQILADFENGEDLTVQKSGGQMQQNRGLTSADLKASRKVEEESLPVAEHNTRGNCDPLTYEEVVKEEKWQKAMAEEIVARMDTIRLVIALAAQNSWPIYRLDVKLAFLHGDLQEHVFVDQPPGYVKFGFEHKEGFQKCPYKPTLYIKFGDGGKLIIVGLCVDDIIYTGNDFGMLEKFKQSMKLEFDMTDLVNKEVKLMKDPGGRFVDGKLYKQIVGSMMYLTATRPDIMHGVSLISRYMEHPKELHLQTAKRILSFMVFNEATHCDFVYNRSRVCGSNFMCLSSCLVKKNSGRT